MMQRILPVLLAIAFILSGCLGGADPEPDTEEDDGMDHGQHKDDDGDGSDDDTGTGGEGEGGQTDLEAILSANVTSGPAPLHVNLTLNVSGPEGDVSWELDLGDNDTEEGGDLPAVVDHIYEEAGNYTVLFTVTFEERTAEANLTISVEGAAVPQPNEPQERPQSFCLDTLVFYLPTFTGISSPFAETVDVDVGTGWVAQSDDGSVQVDFYDSDDGYIDQGSDRDAGTVPEDAAYAIVCIRLETDQVVIAPAPPGGTLTYQDGFLPEQENE